MPLKAIKLTSCQHEVHIDLSKMWKTPQTTRIMKTKGALTPDPLTKGLDKRA